MKWQRTTRLVLVLVVVATVVGVLLTVRKRQTPSAAPGVTRVDPKAIAEAAGGRTTQATGMRIPGFIDYERLLTYEDGSLKFVKPKLTTTRSGREFVLEGNDAAVAKDQEHIAVTGDVVLTANDGLRATTDEATYSSGEQMVRVPRRIEFSKGTLSGSGVGMTYDLQRDVMWLVDQARITVAPEQGKDPGMTIVAGTAGLARRDKYFRFERGFTATRQGRVISSTGAMAYMTDDEQALRSLELRENSRMVMSAAAAGALQAMHAKDMNLTFGPDGETFDHVLLAGAGVLQFAGTGGQPGRRIAADVIDIEMGQEGEVTALVARDNVQLTIPATKDAPERTIRAAAMKGTGEPGRGLTGARFTDEVEFREVKARDQVRTSRSKTLDVVLASDGGIDDARFAGGTVFLDGALQARALDARYLVAKGQLELSGNVGSSRPQVQDARIFVEAVDIALTFEGPKMIAAGEVQSVLKPARRSEGTNGKREAESKVPGMLKDDQPANITAAALDYDGAAKKAIYTGGARLWQGDTAISGQKITIDETTGDLFAHGQVRSAMVLEQTDSKTNEKKKVNTLASAQDMHYEDAVRRATYTTDAHVNGPQGDLRAVKIELYLVEGGGSLERVEAYDAVTVRADARTSTGARMTYFAADEKYVMTGPQVKVVEECRETTCKSLTFFRTTDNVLCDGEQQQRTLTLSGGTCGQASPK